MTEGSSTEASGLPAFHHTSDIFETIVPPGTEHGLRPHSTSGLPVSFTQAEPVPPNAIRWVQLAAKRLLDIVFSSIALVALLPLFAVIALAIKATSPGPIIFRQIREGLHGEPITIYKFRSMYDDKGDATGVAQTIEDDPRITSVGRVIRRANLDELPQLFNILKGDMAMVGPRPHAFGMLASGVAYDQLAPYYRMRQAMKPGLSGWAQVNGYRGPTGDAQTARARIDHDLAYIQNFSLLLDLRIIALTFIREFPGGSGT